MKYFWKEITFFIQMIIIKNRIGSCPSDLLSYPLLLDLEFNEEWYWKRYYERGISVNLSCELFLKIRERKMRRTMNMPKKTWTRLESYRAYKSNAESVDNMFKEHPELKES